jgi:hypothetical protein
MDRVQLLRELSFLEARIADTEKQIVRYREKIAQKDTGRSAEFDATLLRECESVLRLHLSVKKKLERQLSLSASKSDASKQRDRQRM